MRGRSLPLLTLAFIVSVTPACDDDPTLSGPEAGSARELARILQRAGLGCEDFVRDTKAERKAADAVDGGDCTVAGTPVGLSIFENTAQLDVIYSGAGESLACTFAGPVDIETLPSVVGPVWTIAVESSPETGERAERIARRISRKLDASLRIIRCNDDD